MKALVLIELIDGSPSEDSLGVLARVQALGIDTWALLCSDSVAATAAEVSRHPCTGVLTAEAALFASPRPEPRAQLIAELVRSDGYTLVAFATSVLTGELAAQLAAQLDAGVLWGLTALAIENGAIVGTRLTHGDAMRAQCAWRAGPAIALFRAHECAPAVPGQIPAPISAVDPGAVGPSPVDAEQIPSETVTGVSLTAADIIVAGGRGLGQRENLELVYGLADALGGVAGVSLPLVDMGWAPRAMQVGQTGTVVSPRLYVACGISGQIQHKIGIERSGTIVAINTDREAPIMKFCDLGIVGDVRAVVPALIDAVRQARGV